MALQGQQGKTYGLIIRKGQSAAKTAATSSVFERPKRAPRKPPGFTQSSSDSELEHSDSEEQNNTAAKSIGTSKKLAASDYLRMKVRSETQKDIDKALSEDPTCFQYDEVYDDISHSSTMQRAAVFNKTADRKPKYIERLMATAEQRKKEYERRVERQIQKEREAEGDEFDDKEAFVTSAYREKLARMKAEEERERAKEAAEAKMDVTRQNDLSMFYRNILDQTARGPDGEGRSKTEEKAIVDEKLPEKPLEKDRRRDRDYTRSRSRSRSPSHRQQHRQSRRSSSPKNAEKPEVHFEEKPVERAGNREDDNAKNIREKSSTFDKRNADESAVLSARERFLQRKMQRTLPTSDD